MLTIFFTKARELTNIESWYHRARVKNIADLQSKGFLTDNFTVQR